MEESKILYKRLAKWVAGLVTGLSYWKKNSDTVRCRYNAVDFLKHIH